jgi:hypothetical protein
MRPVCVGIAANGNRATLRLLPEVPLGMRRQLGASGLLQFQKFVGVPSKQGANGCIELGIILQISETTLCIFWWDCKRPSPQADEPLDKRATDLPDHEPDVLLCVPASVVLDNPTVGLVCDLRKHEKIISPKTPTRLPLIAVLVDALERNAVPRAVRPVVAPDRRLAEGDAVTGTA